MTIPATISASKRRSMGISRRFSTGSTGLSPAWRTTFRGIFTFPPCQRAGATQRFSPWRGDGHSRPQHRRIRRGACGRIRREDRCGLRPCRGAGGEPQGVAAAFATLGARAVASLSRSPGVDARRRARPLSSPDRRASPTQPTFAARKPVPAGQTAFRPGIVRDSAREGQVGETSGNAAAGTGPRRIPASLFFEGRVKHGRLAGEEDIHHRGTEDKDLARDAPRNFLCGSVALW